MPDRSKHDLETAIEAERRQMKANIETLQARFAPKAIIAGATEEVKAQIGDVAGDAQIALRDTAGALFEKGRKHPVPLAITAFGLAWLLLARDRPRRPARPVAAAPRPAYAPIKSGPTRTAHYDPSPADIAAERLERDADAWAAEQTIPGVRQSPAPQRPPRWADDRTHY